MEATRTSSTSGMQQQSADDLACAVAAAAEDGCSNALHPAGLPQPARGIVQLALLCCSLPMQSPLREALRARETAMFALLRELVEQGSHTADRAGGEAVAEILLRELRSIPGLSVRSRESTRFARTVLARSAAAEDSATSAVGLVGHLDTVFPPGSFEGFRVEGGIARGPGVLDMKGGLVVMLEALRALATVGELPRVPVRFVVVGDEEVGSPESFPWLQEELAGASAALVFESGRAKDRIITARKGTGSATVTATGRAAHAGNAHHEGANAIWALARFIDRAQALTDYDRGVTVNVGTIRGGESKNTVPDHAEARLDYRFVHDLDRQATLAALGAASGRRRAQRPRCQPAPLQPALTAAPRADRRQRGALPRIRRVRAGGGARRRRGAARRRGLGREHHGERGHPVDRRPRAARHGLSHQGRAGGARHVRAQGRSGGPIPPRTRGEPLMSGASSASILRGHGGRFL
jgi:glutamate carboxypeptidase